VENHSLAAARSAWAEEVQELEGVGSIERAASASVLAAPRRSVGKKGWSGAVVGYR
jgi:hypothetical protein